MAFANPEIAREYYSRYRAENKNKIRERDKAFRDANKERLKVSQRQYRQTNHAAILTRQKAYRDSDAGKQYHTAYASTYYANPANRMRLLVNGAMLRARRAGMGFSEDLRSSLMAAPPMDCACCGRVLDYSMGRGRNKRDESPSLDRVNNNLGYTHGNVAVICMRCNSIKTDASLVELETIVQYMRRAHSSSLQISSLTSPSQLQSSHARPSSSTMYSGASSGSSQSGSMIS